MAPTDLEKAILLRDVYGRLKLHRRSNLRRTGARATLFGFMQRLQPGPDSDSFRVHRHQEIVGATQQREASWQWQTNRGSLLT